MNLNETHDPNLKSWVESANDPSTGFPIQNLPFCAFRHGHAAPRIGVGIGDSILDIPDYQSLNVLMSEGRASATELRARLSRVLRDDNPYPPRALLFPMSECALLLPVEIGDYTDFYASIFHATNVGSMFRPDNPLLPNYKYVPIGYHGRTSSVVVSGTPVYRPAGQLQEGSAAPVFEPCRQLDYECELGCFIARGNPLGSPIPIVEAEQHLFGVCLLNDWSARDIQRWEYQPLGPFLAKSFATTISPWVVTLDALEPFRVPRYQRPETDPQPLPYLDCDQDRDRGAIALTIEVWFSTALMREKNLAPIRLSRAQFEQMYWTPGSDDRPPHQQRLQSPHRRPAGQRNHLRTWQDRRPARRDGRRPRRGPPLPAAARRQQATTVAGFAELLATHMPARVITPSHPGSAAPRARTV